MRSDLWRVRECPKKQEKELNFTLQSKEITLQIRAWVLYLGASPVSASWSVKASSSSSFSSSCVTVSHSPWITFEFLPLPSLPSSYKYRSNAQQTAHKMSSLKIQLEILTLLHTEYPNPHFTSKVGPFFWIAQNQRTVRGVRHDFKGKARVGLVRMVMVGVGS